MRALCIHAHFDDYEFVAGGTFELWRQKLGRRFTAKVVVCTDGKAGHHFRTREETGEVRLREQQASAKGARYFLCWLGGGGGLPLADSWRVAPPPLLAALWKTIRDFQPDYLFC